ncbi:MAG: DUF7282 domain-containing protein [Ardenticatenaceae bacterium]
MRRVITIMGLVGLMLAVLIMPVAAQMTPSVTASNQESDGTTVVVESVVSEGPGWIVIHADNNGSPGAVLGFAPVQDGENTDVEVTLDEEVADGTALWAMLHVDTGTVGTYEFGQVEGVDGPVTDSAGAVVMQSFTVTVTGAEEEAGTAPTVEVSDQAVTNQTVTVGTATLEGPGWMAIHASNDAGEVGPVIGFAPLQDGENSDVTVQLDQEVEEGAKLWAMLHEDTGTVGTYEFGQVEGVDLPIMQENGEIAMQPFTVTGASMQEPPAAAPPALPQTGASNGLAIWPLVAVVVGLLLLAGAYVLRPRTP